VASAALLAVLDCALLRGPAEADAVAAGLLLAWLCGLSVGIRKRRAANRVFNEQDISLLAQCFATLPSKRERHEPYNHYIAALTFLALNDVHWPRM
jgi:hypothetical protein